MCLSYMLIITELKYAIYNVHGNQYDEERFEAELVTSHHMQRDTLKRQIERYLYESSDRLDVAMATDDICTAITNGEQVKGLYLYGPFWDR